MHITYIQTLRKKYNCVYLYPTVMHMQPSFLTDHYCMHSIKASQISVKCYHVCLGNASNIALFVIPPT